MTSKWDLRFIGLAQHISTWSKDPSTKVGCVVVGEDREIRSTGFNGFPRGINDDEERLMDREKKYPLICHAEENAIMHAARIGVSLKDSTAYVTWPPCSRCARSLIQAGIREIVYPETGKIPDRWIEDFTISDSMLNEAGVAVRSIKIE
jgi:dCMP deaminase